MSNKKIDFEKIAERIILARDLSIKNYGLGTDHFEEQASIQRDWFHARMINLEATYLSEKKSSSKTAMDLIKDVSELILETAKHNGDKKGIESALRFSWIADEIYTKRLIQDVKAYEEGRRLAIFCLGLSLLGSSARQGFSSLSEWTGKSAKSLESMHSDIKKEKRVSSRLTANIEIFVSTFETELASILVKYSQEPFPNRKGSIPYQKTHNAYVDLRSKIIEHFSHPTHIGFIPIPAPSDLPDIDSYKKLKQTILRLPKK